MSLRSDIRKIQRLVGAKADGIIGPATVRAILNHLEPSTQNPDPKPDPPTGDTTLDDRTLKNLRTLEPKAQAIFLKFILHAKSIAAALGVDYVAISGTRGEKEQNALYAKGRTAPGRKVTNARFGYSNHNFGIALDFGVFAGRKYLDSDDPKRAHSVHRAVAAVADQYGIEWGGDWIRFKDYPHFEVKTDLTMAQKRARVKAGKPLL